MSQAEPIGVTEVLPGLPRPVSPHGRITALSMMKDEGPYLLEWVAHHLAIGFTHFVIYTNDCSDGTDTMLKRLQALGLVEHRDNRIPKGMKPQPSALKYAQAEPEVAKADWLLTFDADEFLSIRLGDGSIGGLIDAVKAQGANGMVITWRIFGSGGVDRWSRAPVTEQYLMAAPPMWNKGWGVKTLFQFDPEVWKLGIHRPKMKNKVLDTEFPDTVKWLNGSGRPMEDYFKFRGWRSITRTVGYDWAQMNHYTIKSKEAYAIRRLRGNVNNKADKYNADYWALMDRNEVRDDTMLRYSLERDRIMTALLADPILRPLHETAVARVEAKLEEIRKTEAYDTLISQLKDAGDIPISRVSAKPPKPRDPDQIAAQMSDVERRTLARRGEELKKPRDQRALPPQDLFVRGPVDCTTEVPLDWHPNHDVSLPADPRLFTPQGLLQITEGKFQRNLARNIGNIASPGPYLEIGAAAGFLGLRLNQVSPETTICMVERDDGWFQALQKTCDANSASPQIRISQDEIQTTAQDLQPGTLVLGDPLAEPDLLSGVLKVSAPQTVVLTGRLHAAREGDLTPFMQLLEDMGFTEQLPLDRSLAVARRRPAPSKTVPAATD